MAEGLDISEHQGFLPPEFFDQWDYVIIRAFNENGYPDKTFNDNWRKAAGRTLRGVYGWPTPFIAGDDFARGQALVDIAPDAEAGYWADVERVSGGVASVHEVEQYLRGIESRGKRAGIYSNIGELPRSPYIDAHDWWMADYGPNNGTRHDPFAQAPVPPPDRPYTIHQYTSNPLDRNWSSDLAWADAPSAPTTPEQRFTKGEPVLLIADTDTGKWFLTVLATGFIKEVATDDAIEMVASGIVWCKMPEAFARELASAAEAQAVAVASHGGNGGGTAATAFDFTGHASPTA